MAAPAGEGLSIELSAPLEQDVADEDIVFTALQQQLGADVRLRNYTALWRKDFEGDASAKRYVGGAVMVQYTVFANGEFQRGEQTIDDGSVAEEIKARLNRQAGRKWGSRSDGFPEEGVVRDYGRG